MSIINRRHALALVPAAITALVPFSAPAKTVTVRKICPVERYWANWKKADADFIAAIEREHEVNGQYGDCTSAEYIEAKHRLDFNQKLLANAIPTTIGGMLALCEYQKQFLDHEIHDDQLTIAANMITSLKNLSS